jgi:hypothetical protein
VQEGTLCTGGVSFPSAEDFKKRLRIYIGDDDVASSKSSLKIFESGFCDRVNALSRFDSVDKLITAIEHVGDLFQNPADLSPNAVVAPIVLMVDSYLGVYVRRLLLDLESYSFEGMCSLFSKLQIYHGVSLQGHNNEVNDQLYIPDNSCTGVHDHDKFVPPLSPRSEFRSKARTQVSFSSNGNCSESLISAQLAVRDMDMPHAESILHDYFDTATDLTRTERGIDYNVFDVQHSPAPPVGPYQNNRHQYALLTLSSAAAQTSNLDQALMAVEEAIKVAHQRGDHASVAQSLLLTHFIMRRMSISRSATSVDGKEFFVHLSQLRDSSEDVLLRCVSQSFCVSIPKLTYQASLALVEHMVENEFLLQSISGKIHVDYMWNLLHAVKARNLAVAHEQFKRIGISPSHLAPPVAYVEVMSRLEHLIIQIQALGSGALVWLKLGMPYMAINTLRRALRLLLRFPVFVRPQDVVDIMLSFVGKLAILVVSSCVIDSALQEVNESEGILSIASQLVGIVRSRLLPLASVPSANAFRCNEMITRLLVSLNDRCESYRLSDLLTGMFGSASRSGACSRMITAFLTLPENNESSLTSLSAIEDEFRNKAYNQELAMCLVLKGISLQDAGSMSMFSNHVKTESLLLVDSGLSINTLGVTSLGLCGAASAWLERKQPDSPLGEHTRKLCVSVAIESLLMQ